MYGDGNLNAHGCVSNINVIMMFIGSLSAYANVDQYFTLRSFAEIIGMISVNLIMWYCN